MAGILPRDPIVGSPISASWGSDVVNQHRKSQVTGGAGMSMTQTSGGTVISARRQRRQAVAAIFPFQMYQSDPPESSGSSESLTAWRTIRVRQGLVTNLHPEADADLGSDTWSDDSFGDDESWIVLPASATTKIYIECDISDVLDATEGTVKSVTGRFNNLGWSGYPKQPLGDSATGKPPNKFYILLGAVTTGVDGPADDPAYRFLQLPSPQPIQSSLWVEEMTFGNPTTDADGNCIIQKRMSLTAL